MTLETYLQARRTVEEGNKLLEQNLRSPLTYTKLIDWPLEDKKEKYYIRRALAQTIAERDALLKGE